MDPDLLAGINGNWSRSSYGSICEKDRERYLKYIHVGNFSKVCTEELDANSIIEMNPATYGKPTPDDPEAPSGRNWQARATPLLQRASRS